MIKKILVPLDGSQLAERVLPYASDVAAALNATLILLKVVPSPPGRWGGVFKAANASLSDVQLPDTPEDLDKSLHPVSKESQMASLESEVKRELMPTVERLSEMGLNVELAVAFGRPASGILKFAQDEEVDLIAICTHGERGVTPYAFSGTTDRVARRACIPVLFVRPEEVCQLLPIPKSERLEP